MKKILAAALASVMLVGGAALAAADGELNICSPNSDGLLSIIPVFEEQTGIKVNVESIGTGDCMKRIESEIAQEYSTFDLMYGGTWFYPVHQNVIWTLLLGLLGIRAMEAVREKKKTWLYVLTCAAVCVFGYAIGTLAMLDY